MLYLSTWRRVHLDFHTPGFIENVAEKFDPGSFARTLEESGVEAVAAFAKCHYGNAYYPTKVGLVHPGLKFDLLGSIVAACRQRSIDVAAYYSLQFDNHFCNEHPDCEQVRPDRETCPAGFWRVPCINSNYRDYVKAQIAEIASGYPVAGLWIDIVGYYPACVCERCRELYERDTGAPAPDLAGLDEKHRNYMRFVHWQRGCVDSLIQEIREVARAENPRIAVGCNTSSGVYEKASAAFDAADDHIIEEACSSYPSHHTYTSYFPRLLSSDPKKRSYEIVTQRFHQGWGDWSLRSPDWLKYEVATIVANGGRASIGDQLYPDGRWEPEVYRTIGEVYHWLCERGFVLGETESAAETAVYVAGTGVHRDAGGTHVEPAASRCAEGAFRALLDSQYPVDLITRANLSDLRRYRTIIIDQPLAPTPDELSALAGYLQSGGNLVHVVSPESLNGELAWSDYRCDPPGPEAHSELLRLFGITDLAPSEFSVAYIDRVAAALPFDWKGLPVLVRGRSAVPSLLLGLRPLAYFTYPAVERSPDRFISHQHGHPAVPTSTPAITLRELGAGKAIFIAAPVTSVYFQRLYDPLRRLLVACLDYLAPRPAQVLNAPTALELVLRSRPGELIAHLIHPSLGRPGVALQGEIPAPAAADRAVTLTGLELLVRADLLPGRMATLWPGGRTLDLARTGDYARIQLPPLSIHAAVRFG